MVIKISLVKEDLTACTTLTRYFLLALVHFLLLVLRHIVTPHILALKNGKGECPYPLPEPRPKYADE
jgi:hypothetical protein